MHEVETRHEDLHVVARWLDAKDYTAAGRVLTSYLTDSPDCVDGWFLMGRLLIEQDNPAMARMVYGWIVTTEAGRERWQNWHNLGHAFDRLNQAEQAEKCYLQALEMSPDEQAALVSLGTCYVQQYRSQEAADTCRRAIELYPQNGMARSSLGFALLQMRQYAEGWDAYEAGYGKLRWRIERNYTGEPRWDGERRKSLHIAVHGEQGIGDQIAGCEPLADLARDCTVESVEVTPKIAPLIQRSFPDLAVHDTLHEDRLDWTHRVRVDCHTGLFSVHRHYRRRREDYPGKPYLVADPRRRLQWRTLLDSLGPEPKIGIAWSGGVAITQRVTRKAPLETWIPILRQSAHFIALEYKDRSADIEALQRRRSITIHDWPWGTRTDDYDDTAALVAELDLVITVPTTVVHLAGALGVPVWCMTHPCPNVHYGAAGYGDDIPYYGDRVVQYRRKSNDEWTKTANKVARALEAWLDERVAA